MFVKIFAIIGVALLEVICVFIYDAINNRKYKKQLKSRFEGGHTAKCFCKDCIYYEKIKDTKHDSSTGECAAHNWWGVRDNCYCWDATPLYYDVAKRREEIEKGK